MNIVKWEPFSELTTFRERLGRVLDESLTDGQAPNETPGPGEPGSTDKPAGGAQIQKS
ncbi:MAG: hypothetical protein NTZ26_08810 [Candidatus Aminicenantes bacterium]|nr:hypothetical protein [Candidatus Aminicenantes bacterium]